MSVVRYGISHREVDELLELLHDEVAGAAGPSVRRERWKAIGDALLAPALAQLPDDITLLYVVPLGGLHAVPWHACPVSGHLALERFPIVYAPTAAAAVHLADPDRPVSLPSSQSLVIGDPEGNLRSARREAEAVAERLSTEAVVGGAATVRAASNALRTAEWAHFSAHGRFVSGEPLDSGIVMSDGVLAARALMTTRIADGVVVSTCESGRQRQEAGDELWGLGRALLYAGARTAVLSLWPVGDRVTERLMLRFYDHLDAGSNGAVVAEALRRAMLDTRAEDDRTYLWAPFFLLGNPYGS